MRAMGVRIDWSNSFFTVVQYSNTLVKVKAAGFIRLFDVQIQFRHIRHCTPLWGEGAVDAVVAPSSRGTV